MATRRELRADILADTDARLLMHVKGIEGGALMGPDGETMPVLALTFCTEPPTHSDHRTDIVIMDTAAATLLVAHMAEVLMVMEADRNRPQPDRERTT